MATTTVTTVGQFSYDEATGEIKGPAAYMESDYFAAWKRRFDAGNDVVFRYGVQSGESPSPIVAMLVSIQTDFAGWMGMQSLLPKGA